MDFSPIQQAATRVRQAQVKQAAAWVGRSVVVEQCTAPRHKYGECAHVWLNQKVTLAGAVEVEGEVLYRIVEGQQMLRRGDFL